MYTTNQATKISLTLHLNKGVAYRSANCSVIKRIVNFGAGDKSLERSLCEIVLACCLRVAVYNPAINKKQWPSLDSKIYIKDKYTI